jgi:hypothetical protein
LEKNLIDKLLVEDEYDNSRKWKCAFKNSNHIYRWEKLRKMARPFFHYRLINISTLLDFRATLLYY